jgi:hypothetical protein
MPVSLRDHLEVVAKAEEKRVNVLFGIAVAVALFVWIEIERRLGILNHAHEKAVEVQHTYVSEDVYEQDRLNRDEKIGAVQRSLAALRTTRATTVAVVTVGCSVVAVVVLLANGVI